MEGEPEAVMDYYNAMLADHQNQEVKQELREDGKVQTISGTGDATVVGIALLDIQDRPLEVVDVGQAVRLRIKVQAHKAIERLVLGYGIKDRLGQVIYGTNTHHKERPLLGVSAGDKFVFEIAFLANLGPGTYSVQTALTRNDTHLSSNYEWRDLALIFNVININKPYFEGCAWVDSAIRVKKL
jgi:lipopolysaccharide transport system ATP-binding protein